MCICKRFEIEDRNTVGGKKTERPEALHCMDISCPGLALYGLGPEWSSVAGWLWECDHYSQEWSCSIIEILNPSSAGGQPSAPGSHLLLLLSSNQDSFSDLTVPSVHPQAEMGGDQVLVDLGCQQQQHDPHRLLLTAPLTPDWVWVVSCALGLAACLRAHWVSSSRLCSAVLPRISPRPRPLSCLRLPANTATRWSHQSKRMPHRLDATILTVWRGASGSTCHSTEWQRQMIYHMAGSGQKGWIRCQD